MRRLSLFIAGLLLAAPAGAKVVRLRVVHTNDVHGWILPRPDKKHGGRMVGGAAALSAFVKTVRAEGPTLLLDAGDWWQGTPEGSIPEGRAVAELFDAIGYDATTPGNHDYDAGEASLSDLSGRMKTPVIASNIASKATGAPVPYVKPFMVKKVGGVKVGIFGLLTTQMRRLSFEKNIAGIEFQPEVEAARKAVAALKAQGAEVVIMLSHVGQERGDAPAGLGDQTVAREVPGIDMVVGGHSHIPLEPALKAGDTLIVNTGCYLERAGKVVLDYDSAAGKVVAATSTLHRLWIDEVGQDPAVKAITERWEQQVGKALDVVVATAAVALTRDRASDSPMGNWMTDCLRRWSKTDIAFQNAGGIRTEFGPGPVRLRDIFSLMPFDNRVTTVYVKGVDLKDLFEHSVGKAPGVLQLSGAAVTFDPAKPMGERVAGIEVRGRALEPEALYSVAAADFIVQGGDGFGAFSNALDRADHDTLIRDVLGWCAREAGEIKAPVGGRLKKL